MGLQTQIETINQRIYSLKTQLQGIKHENDKKNIIINTLNSDIKAYQDKVTELLNKVESIQHQFQQKISETDVLQKHNNSLLLQINEYKQELILLANEHEFIVNNLDFEK